MSEFRDGPTIEGPIEAFLKPGSTIGFMRGKELCEGTAIVDHVDQATKTVYFTTPLPAGIKAGDKAILL